MKRKSKIKQVDAILCSDIHLREDTPVCREPEEFQESQWNKLDFISNLQSRYGCKVLHGGDLFHHWKPSPWLLGKAIEHLPEQFHTVYGQHDLPQHNIDLHEKTGIWVLTWAKKVFPSGAHWGQKPRINNSMLIGYKRVAIWHKFVYIGKPPWPGCTEPKAHALLNKYKRYDLILTGDNHKPFVSKVDGRLLVNPGSMMRQNSDQEDFKPRVYLYDAENNEVEPVYLPIKKGVVSREHIDNKKERDERIHAFISKLSGEWESGLSFEENLSRFKKTNKVRKDIFDLIYKAMEEVK